MAEPLSAIVSRLGVPNPCFLVKVSVLRTRSALPLFLPVALFASCAAGAREPVESGLGTRRAYTGADVRFIQGMIHHHAQALAMTALVPGRTRNEDLRQLARRIEISQQDEIARMRRWLDARSEEVPSAHAHGPLMPGMLTEEDLSRLGAASDAEFDRLFLEFMIRHHEGALIMIEDLLSTDGAGQEAEIFQFVSHVDADQRAEIARMRGVLGTAPQGGMNEN